MYASVMALTGANCLTVYYCAPERLIVRYCAPSYPIECYHAPSCPIGYYCALSCPIVNYWADMPIAANIVCCRIKVVM